MSKLKDFETMGVTRVLFKYSVPAVIATSVQALYNIVDRIYVGKGLGTHALGGLTLTFPIFLLSIAIGVLFGAGSSAVISLKLGEKKKDEAEAALGSTYFLYFLMGCLIAISGIIFLEPLLRLVGATEATLPYARRYLAVFLPFMPLDFMAMGTNGAIRSEGNPQLAMIIAVGCALLNIILDPLFLFLFHWGVAGVAWATVLSRIVAAFVVMWHFTKGSRRHLTLRRKNFRYNGPIVKKMTAIGMAPCLFNIATTFVAVFSNRALVKYGDETALGALGAIMSIYTIIQTPMRGIQMGAQPVIGYNYGARLYGRVGKTLTRSYQFALIIAIAGMTGAFLFGSTLMGLFSRGDNELIAMGVRGMSIYMAMLPFLAVQMISVTFFQSLGKPSKAIVLNLAQSALFYLIALAVLPRFLGLDGVWAATSFSHLAGGVLAFFLVIPERAGLRKYEKEGNDG